MTDVPNRLARVAAATALAAALAAAGAAHAGIHYVQQQKTETDARGAAPGDMEVEGWVQGEKAKIVFRETGRDTPFMKEGQYLITHDGGATVWLADPEKETLTEWDLEAMFGMLGGMMQAMGDMMEFEFRDPKVERLESRAGGTLLGLDTTYAKYRTTYRLEMSIMGMQRSQDVETIQEMWSTDKPTDLALGVWLQRRPPVSGIEGLDELLEAEMAKMEDAGFPLKTVQTTTTTQYGRKGNEKGTQTMTMTSTVTLWEETAVADDVFAMPDWERVSMAEAIPQAEAPADDEAPEEGGKKKSWRDLLRRK